MYKTGASLDSCSAMCWSATFMLLYGLAAHSTIRPSQLCGSLAITPRPPVAPARRHQFPALRMRADRRMAAAKRLLRVPGLYPVESPVIART
jgi:hypothetical protein